ncbi:aspartate/glutamate racemase family protein [Pseudofrankia saprophytica]|uniref:aspartate/glutamate racemase family protein n=1 Tax=Pseudofrankia saprophytica TaxID=298655 RepID=UPI000234C039|nr:aspartate/glutamate racemase family protein [Pseudofrankia saprophytica]
MPTTQEERPALTPGAAPAAEAHPATAAGPEGSSTAPTGPLIRVINPNTSRAMTELIGTSARQVAQPGTRIEATSPAMGPASIESHYDEALAVPGVLAEIARGEEAGAAGYVIACFGDPGLDAARELARGPVIGIAEAAMRAASFLGRSFGVVTTLGRTRGRTWDLADRYGLRVLCCGVRACEVPVLELETDPLARAKVLAECRAAVADDEAEVIVLGCAGMADLCQALTAELGVPVVDGVAAATVLVEGLIRLGLATSQRGEYAAPPPKPYTGLLAPFGGAGQSSH